MKRTIQILCIVILVAAAGLSQANQQVYLNAFGETATAYLNDSFLLLGTTADSFAADIIPKETALEIAKNVQKRVRLIRGKLKAVAASKLADTDSKLMALLDSGYACMDHQSWALIQYMEDKTPDNARKFESQRTECLSRLKKIAEFYMTLPPSPEAAEPLSTR